MKPSEVDEILRRAVEEGTDRLDGGSFRVLVAEVKRLRAERDAILRWSIRHAGYIGTRINDDGAGSWWTSGDMGRVFADTAEQAVRKAAGLESEPKGWSEG